MTETDGHRETEGYREHAGIAHWPRTPDDLTRTDRCPACFSALAAAVCSTCGLDLTHPAAQQLLDASTAAAQDLDRRLDIIGRIRFETAVPRVAVTEAERREPQERNAVTDAALVAARPETTTLTTSPSTSRAEAAVPPAVAQPPRSASSLLSAVPQPARPDTPPPPATFRGTRAGSPPGTPRRSSIQLVLLIVGVSALSVGAIAFLVYAFVNYGIVWRSVIIGAVTVAAFVAATLLNHRSLRATAEGIAAFAVVLVYLDAYAIRANDLFGAASVDGAVYWGAALVLASVAFIGWHRVGGRRAAGLRVPSVAGFAGFSPGLGLLVAGLSRDLNGVDSAYLAFAAIALGGIIHRLAGRAPTQTVPGHTGGVERAIALAASVAALALASVVAAALRIGRPDPDATAPVLALLGVAAIAVIHLAVLRSPRTEPRRTDGWAIAFGVVVGLSLATIGFAVVGNGGFASSGSADGGFGDDGSGGGLLADTWQVTPVVVAAFAALVLEAIARRAADPVSRVSAHAAAWSAAAIGAIAILIPLTTALATLAFALTRSLTPPWSLPPDGRIDPVSSDLEPVTALALVVVLAAVVWGATGVVRRRTGVIGWSAAVVLVLAVPLLGVVWMMVAAWFALGIAAIVALLVTRARSTEPLARSLRRPAVGLLAASTAAGWTMGWASSSTWAIAAAVTITITITARYLVVSTVARAALIGVASALIIIAASSAARQFTNSGGSDAWTDDPIRVAGLSAIVLLASAAIVTARSEAASERLVPLRVTDTDRRTVFWVALVTIAGTEVVLRLAALPSLVFAAPLAEFAARALLLGALLTWVALRSTVTFRLERIATSIALGPAVYLVVEAFVDVLGAPDLLRSVAPMTAAVLTAAGSLAVALIRPGSPATRPFREIGVVLVAAPALARALVTADPFGWLVLILGAIVALLSAISVDGLFASRSIRRQIGWLAVGLATAGLWLRLSDDSISAVEPFVFPVAGLLLLVALGTWRAAGRRGNPMAGGPMGSGLMAGERADDAFTRSETQADAAPRASLASPLILLAGLLTAVLPIAAYSATGGPQRAIFIGASSALLLLIGSLIGRGDDSTATRPYLDAVALAGAVGVLVTSVGRAAVLLSERPGSAELDAWVLGGMAVLVAAAFGIASIGDDRFRRQRTIAGQALAVIALTAVLVIEVVAVIRVDAGIIRPLAVVLLLAAVHLLAFLVDRPPFTRSVAWLSVGYAIVVAATGIAAGSLDPLEAGSIPIALALIATGTAHLERTPPTRSWPWLGPGIILLLAPSLVATIDDRPLWRLVGIGVVGVTIIVIGVVRRLQAPFVVGSAVVLVHAIATFAPQIRATYESVAWWLWLVIGGILLIVLAARYEQRLKNLRGIVERVGSLR